MLWWSIFTAGEVALAVFMWVATSSHRPRMMRFGQAMCFWVGMIFLVIGVLCAPLILNDQVGSWVMVGPLLQKMMQWLWWIPEQLRVGALWYCVTLGLSWVLATVMFHRVTTLRRELEPRRPLVALLRRKNRR